ncbi:MAG: methylaspartate mutase subunit E [Spirochaetia bacterium]|nr:methylaspartate mutase subunit E [Spirochaetia bacterium]
MNTGLDTQKFTEERKTVLQSWPTGSEVDLEEAFAFHQSLPKKKVCSIRLQEALDQQVVLLQPRAGVALVDEHIRLLSFLQEESDLLPTTIDAYTRQNKYADAQKGIERSEQAQRSLLNGFPAVNHGVHGCRSIIEALDKPVEIRHGTPDARLLTEIALAGGFTSYEGGGISYNIPYAKNVPLEKSIRDWQYVDHLVGIYEAHGCSINREPFGPLSGTLVPPCVSHTVAIIEGLLALEQGVKSLTLGYGQAGNLVQDIAAMRVLKKLADGYFRQMGYTDYQLSTVFHQWMGGFPESEAQAFAVISWGGVVASLSGATKVIVKTPHEALGIPTKEANRDGLLATRQSIQMVADLSPLDTLRISEEEELITSEVTCLMRSVIELGAGDLAAGAVRAFEAGVIDVPFAPAVCNAGKVLPVRDNDGAVRLFDTGSMPLSSDILAYHRDKIAHRAKQEKREASFQMVIDDIYAISKGRLVGRPT